MFIYFLWQNENLENFYFMEKDQKLNYQDQKLMTNVKQTSVKWKHERKYFKHKNLGLAIVFTLST